MMVMAVTEGAAAPRGAAAHEQATAQRRSAEARDVAVSVDLHLAVACWTPASLALHSMMPNSAKHREVLKRRLDIKHGV